MPVRGTDQQPGLRDGGGLSSSARDLASGPLPAHATARLQRAPTSPHVVPGSTPVLSFGDPSTATVATLGLNPSRKEFLGDDGPELDGSSRRLETLWSLGVRSLEAAPEKVLRRIDHPCNVYFHRNPYRRWLDQLEPMLQSVGGSYYDDSAAIDLVQWATNPVWGKLHDRSDRDRTLTEDAAFLKLQLASHRFKILLINRRGVSTWFERSVSVSLEEVDTVSGRSTSCRISCGYLAWGTRVIAWSVNIQSSFGVSKELRAAIADRARSLGRGYADV